MTAAAEANWWSRLSDDEAFENTAGNPPYDATAVAGRILATITDRRRVLDLGCGMGRLTNVVASILEDPERVIGVDHSFEMLERALLTAPANAHFYRCDGRHLPPMIGRFSGAYSIAVFQHIPDDARWGYLRSIHAALIPGAPFIFTIAVGDADEFLNHQIPDPEAWAWGLADLFEKVSLDPEPDERGWTWITAWKAE